MSSRPLTATDQRIRYHPSYREPPTSSTTARWTTCAQHRHSRSREAQHRAMNASGTSTSWGPHRTPRTLPPNGLSSPVNGRPTDSPQGQVRPQRGQRYLSLAAPRDGAAPLHWQSAVPPRPTQLAPAHPARKVCRRFDHSSTCQHAVSSGGSRGDRMSREAPETPALRAERCRLPRVRHRPLRYTLPTTLDCVILGQNLSIP